MRTGWKRWGAFLGIVALLVAFVTVATWNETQSSALLLTEVAFIAVVSYLITFLIWPRQLRVSRAHPSRSPAPPAVPAEPALYDHDPRPVLVIGDRPAGSKPGTRVHLRDTPTLRGGRGRRPGPRSRRDIQWPASR